MSYAFKARTGVGHQVRHIVRSQVDKAIAAAKSPGDFDATVHALRRRCKKLRGILRLVQPNFDAYATENAAVRDAAGLLGGARDARVMVETLDALSLPADEARDYLVVRADRIARDSAAEAPLDGFIRILSDFQTRVDDWSFDANGFDLVGDGLEKTFRQFRRDFEQALETEAAESMHEWRKHAKYHWFHVSLLERSAPDLLTPREKIFDRLGELLGDHHNLAVLEETLRQSPALLQSNTAIGSAIARRQDELARIAFGLGHQLAAEKPAALRARFEGYWALLPRES